MEVKNKRRKWYRPESRHDGCQDCGRWGLNVTDATFWVNGYRMRLCRDCIRLYRKVLLKP